MIVFLGNVGPRYNGTRHNVGFAVGDILAKRCGVSINRLRSRALTARANIGGHDVLLVKPQTFMNLSGEAVRPLADYFKIPPERVLVVSDEVALVPGRLRMRASGSAGGHNGLKNIILHLGTENFPRLRVGVGSPPHPDYDMADWVMGVPRGEDAAALTVKRGSRTIELSAEPEKDEDGEYCLGAWVRDSMAGIGTMTFFDPQSGTFGALGHGVTDVDTGQLLPLDHGSIMDASVKAVKKGERASPGELKGDFDLTRDSGTLYANTECGIFGKLSAEDAAKITGAALPIAKKDEIKTGRAAILATVSGNETREYDIEIEKIYSPSGSTRNLLLRVTDEELLAQTGGVVQGMSGSAILQDGKIIGAVTHVLLDDPSRGYGIFIENMLSAAGLSSE